MWTFKKRKRRAKPVFCVSHGKHGNAIKFAIMGMYDTITCEYPLPLDRVGLNAKVYQTKSFDRPSLESYHIRADGSLWRKDFPTQNTSVWTPIPYTGEITFYDFYDPSDMEGWIEFTADFREGHLQTIRLVEVSYPRKESKRKAH